MEEQNPYRYSEENACPTPNMRPNAPNAVASLVLGICSIVLGCGCIGIILSIIGLVISKSGKDITNYDESRYNQIGLLKAGRICSIIGLILGILSFFWMLYIIVCGLFYTASMESFYLNNNL